MRDLETGTERREHVEERPPLIGLWVLPHMLEESLEELANDSTGAEGERAAELMPTDRELARALWCLKRSDLLYPLRERCPRLETPRRLAIKCLTEQKESRVSISTNSGDKRAKITVSSRSLRIDREGPEEVCDLSAELVRVAEAAEESWSRLREHTQEQCEAQRSLRGELVDGAESASPSGRVSFDRLRERCPERVDELCPL